MRQISQSKSLVTTLAITAIYAELCISANFLTFIGLPYVTEGGALLLKLHPGTDLLIVSCGLLMFLEPMALTSQLPKSLRTYLISIIICFVYSIIFTGMDNLIVLLDTFLPAGLAAAIICNINSWTILRLRQSMQWLFGLNAVIALMEAVMKYTFIPFYLGDEAYRPADDDFRPTALYDHPLTGALMTMMGLALAPSSGRKKLGYSMLMWAAMLAFGGRIAIAVSLAAVVVTKGKRMLGESLSRSWQSRQRLFLVAAGLLLAAPIVVLISLSGFADRLSGHLYWDASAQARLEQWDILTFLDARQITFGTPRRELLENLNALRLSSGIGVLENFWLLMFVSLGIVGFPIFLIAIGSLCVWCWKISGQKGRLLLVSVLIVASSSNSLGRKSTVLVCLVASVACTKDVQLPVRRATPWRGSSRPVQIA